MFIFGGSSKASKFTMGGSLASMQTRLVLASSSASTEYSLSCSPSQCVFKMQFYVSLYAHTG